MRWVLSLQQSLATRAARRVHPDEAPRRAAVAGLVRLAPEPALLMIQRAEHPCDPWSGHMAWPGGHVEDGERPLQAAIRETREEVGVDLAREAKMLGRLDDIRAVGRGRVLPMAISPYIFASARELNFDLDPDEVQDALWVPLDFLADAAQVTDFDFIFEGRPRSYPCYRYRGKTIWGLTFLMIRQLIQWYPRP